MIHQHAREDCNIPYVSSSVFQSCLVASLESFFSPFSKFLHCSTVQENVENLYTKQMLKISMKKEQETFYVAYQDASVARIKWLAQSCFAVEVLRCRAGLRAGLRAATAAQGGAAVAARSLR